MRQALAAVHADRFVDALPQGAWTPVAERGATLSTGQKQLLSFARALAFNPRILVLDDALSAVDTETDSLEPMRARIVGISFAVQPGEAAYLKTIEYGATPLAYFYGHFVLDPTKNWLGKRDYRYDDPAGLKQSLLPRAGKRISRTIVKTSQRMYGHTAR
mgnify:CR=1 FL=1